MRDDLENKNISQDCGCGAKNETEQTVDTTRRRFAAATLSAPIAASLIARPVWGSSCSPTGFLSGNLSTPNDDDECRGAGCTPGFWKGAVLLWANPGWGFSTTYHSGVVSSGSCAEFGNGNSGCKVWTDDGSLFTAVFPPTLLPLDGLFPSDVTVYGVIKNHQNGNGSPYGSYGTFLFHTIAFLLNSIANPGSFGASPQDLFDVLYAVFVDTDSPKYGDWMAAKELFVSMNEAGNCPLDHHGDCENGYTESGTTFVPNEVGECIPVCGKGEVWDAENLVCVIPTDV